MIPTLILFALGAYCFAKLGAYAVAAGVAHHDGDDVSSRRLTTLMAKHATLGVLAWGLGVCGIIWLASQMREGGF